MLKAKRGPSTKRKPKNIIWSPAEELYLLEHDQDPLNQLSIMLLKSVTHIRQKLAELKGLPSIKAKGGIKITKNKQSNIGTREDLGISLRSSMEANFARYMNYMGWEWEFEPKTFFFNQIRRGTVCYTPDFYIKTIDKWVEVKGYFRPQCKTKLKRFKKFFPDEFDKMIGVCNSGTATEKFMKKIGVKEIICYKQITKEVSSKIKHWEGKHEPSSKGGSSKS